MRIAIGVTGALVVAGIVTAIVLQSLAASPPESDGPANSSAPATAGPSPGGTPGEGSEVMTPDPSAPPENQLPPRTPPVPLITAPLPASASGASELVSGFPVDIMGPLPDSDVTQNSVAVEGSSMQVSLVARTDIPESDVLAYFGELWVSLGLSPSSDAPKNTVSYAGTFESLTVTTQMTGTGVQYSIFGVFRTE